MTVLLQKKNRSAYLESLSDTWTPEKEKAYIFTHSVDAVMHCFKSQISDAQLVATFPNSEMDIVFPIDCPARQQASG
jgi:hypothetical protein